MAHARGIVLSLCSWSQFRGAPTERGNPSDDPIVASHLSLAGRVPLKATTPPQSEPLGQRPSSSRRLWKAETPSRRPAKQRLSLTVPLSDGTFSFLDNWPWLLSRPSAESANHKALRLESYLVYFSSLARCCECSLRSRKAEARPRFSRWHFMGIHLWHMDRVDKSVKESKQLPSRAYFLLRSGRRGSVCITSCPKLRLVRQLEVSLASWFINLPALLLPLPFCH
jgi:hypothetical protein